MPCVLGGSVTLRPFQSLLVRPWNVSRRTLVVAYSSGVGAARLRQGFHHTTRTHTTHHVGSGTTPKSVHTRVSSRVTSLLCSAAALLSRPSILAKAHTPSLLGLVPPSAGCSATMASLATASSADATKGYLSPEQAAQVDEELMRQPGFSIDQVLQRAKLATVTHSLLALCSSHESRTLLCLMVPVV